MCQRTIWDVGAERRPWSRCAFLFPIVASARALFGECRHQMLTITDSSNVSGAILQVPKRRCITAFSVTGICEFGGCLRLETVNSSRGVVEKALVPPSSLLPGIFLGKWELVACGVPVKRLYMRRRDHWHDSVACSPLCSD